MSGNISVFIEKDEVTPALKGMTASLSPERLAARIGPAVQDLVEKHLAGLGPNKEGWPSTGFYEKFARNVRWGPQPDGVFVGILPVIIKGRWVGLRQRVFGGDIKPVYAKALAIPISPVSYGHWPSEFPGLFMIKTPKGAYLVQYGSGVNATGEPSRKGAKAQGGNYQRRQKAAINFLFKLSFGVSQEGDREVLPSDQKILDTAMKAITDDKGGIYGG